MAKKRVLMLSTTYFPVHGGAEKMIYELCTRLSQDFIVDLVVPNFGGKEVDKKGDFTVYRVGKEHKSKVSKFVNYQHYLYKKSVELMEKNDYALIHTHYIFPTAFVAKRLKKKFDVPILTTEHHYGTGMDIMSYKQNPFPVNTIMKRQVKSLDYLVSTGKTQDEFLNYLGVKHFDTVELGGSSEVSSSSESSLRKKLKIGNDKKVLFSLARIVERKRYDIMIEAAKILSVLRNDFVFVIAGKGPLLEELRLKVIEESLEDKVKFVGFIDGKTITEYRKIATAFVSTSEFEGFGITYLDAFGSKLPLFAKKNQASEVLVEDGRSGVLFDSAQGLAERLHTLLSKPKELDKLARVGYELHKQKYNWDVHAKKYKSLYIKIIKEHGKR